MKQQEECIVVGELVLISSSFGRWFMAINLTSMFGFGIINWCSFDLGILENMSCVSGNPFRPR